MRQEHLCGMSFWHPNWLQKYATTKIFMGVYGLLGTVQAMSYMYFVVTLTTIEKRFKMPSQTTGIVLSGNEISQILLSLILSYAGGQRNRPRWIAWGVVFCGLSCFTLVLPHFMYGAGDDLLHLTQEYIDSIGGNINISMITNTSAIENTANESHQLCRTGSKSDESCNELTNIMPLILIFLSQFILGIGNTLYYALGQTYLDDNTKKTNTPLMLAYAMALRMIGPAIGFFLGFISLNMFIDPRKTPLIDQNDPRWLGAWWFGWILLGSAMLVFAGLIGMFPKELPKSNKVRNNTQVPLALRDSDFYRDDIAVNKQLQSDPNLDKSAAAPLDFPKLQDFPKALVRLLKNKLLMYNNISAVFYVLGASGFMTFMTRYMEVQFLKTSQSATVLIGPLTISGMVLGLLLSGWIISKKKPSASKVLLWNVIIGFTSMIGQVLYLFLYCGDTQSMMLNGVLNINSTCNQNCSCNTVAYNPVCYVPTKKTYFSPCHAGCKEWNISRKVYEDCSCISGINSWNYSNIYTSTLSPDSISAASPKTSKPIYLQETETTSSLYGTTYNNVRENSDSSKLSFLMPGPCVEGCDKSVLWFSIVALIINWLGSSGKIGNMLVNYRAVTKEDKSFAQGLTLMMLSLFALIPGPIIFGRLIDNTCLIWNYKCGSRGNCQLYDQKTFRYVFNLGALCLTILGAFFDGLVWYHGKELDLYGEKEEKRESEQVAVVKPLLKGKTSI